MNPRWLSCSVSDGLFPGEMAVTVKTQTQDVSLFLPKSEVRTVEEVSAIKVDLVDEDLTSCFVALPSSAIEGPRVVKVAKGMVLR
jgi:hypothetical protein